MCSLRHFVMVDAVVGPRHCEIAFRGSAAAIDTLLALTVLLFGDRVTQQFASNDSLVAEGVCGMMGDVGVNLASVGWGGVSPGVGP
jgi:hypothetical protein